MAQTVLIRDPLCGMDPEMAKPDIQMFERWLEKVSYGYLTPSSGGDAQTSPDPRMLCFVPVSVWMMGAEAASSLLV